jgi:hypothetical protein
MPLPKTLSPSNEFRIVCPIFGAETRIADCFALEQRVCRGEQIEERKGCQACISSSKCPIRRITHEMIREGSDPYHSTEPRVGQLQPRILDLIHPIIVRDEVLNRLAVPTSERLAIEAANEAASASARGKAPRKATGAVELEAVDKTPRKPAKAAQKPQEPDALTQAAMTGDMSAAVTRAVQKAAEAPAPKPVEPKPTDAEIEAVADKAVNRLAKAISKPAAPAPAPAGKGMSLLEMARARAAAAAQKEATA